EGHSALAALRVEGAPPGEPDRLADRIDSPGERHRLAPGRVRLLRSRLHGVDRRRGGARALRPTAAGGERENEQGEQDSAPHQYFRSSGCHFVLRTSAQESSGAPSTQRVIECLRKLTSSRVG